MWRKFAGLSVLALSLTMWACENVGDVTLPELGSSELAAAKGKSPKKSAPVVDAPVVDAPKAKPTKYKVAEGIYNGPDRKDSRVIDAGGGSIGIAGNVLIVPAGAVTRPTLFEMKLASVDSLGYTANKVDLEAYVQDYRGQYKVAVGSKGFLVPLKLRLTYDWVTSQVDPSEYRIVWLKDAEGDQVVYPTTLDPSGRTASTFLDHFSAYGLGWAE